MPGFWKCDGCRIRTGSEILVPPKGWIGNMTVSFCPKCKKIPPEKHVRWESKVNTEQEG